MTTATTEALSLGDTVRVIATHLPNLLGRVGTVTLLPTAEYPTMGYNADFDGLTVSFERDELELVHTRSRPVKKTFYWQYRSELGHADWPQRKAENQVIWWPENCEKIEVDVSERKLYGTTLPADYLDADLEAAAEAIMVAEFHKNKHSSTHRLNDDADLMIAVSRSPDEPGKLFRVTLELEPHASVTLRETKNPIRLPTAEELAEAENA